MITNIENEGISKCLNVGTLELGIEDKKFCKIVKVVQKFDMSGAPYLSLSIRGLDGNQIMGRIFGEEAKSFLSEWSSWEGKIAYVHFATDLYMGRICLVIYAITLPDEKLAASIDADCFDSKIDIKPINKTMSNLEEMLKDSEYFSGLESVLNSSTFSNLLYVSDDDILLGKVGGILTVACMTIDTLITNYNYDLITKEDLLSASISIIVCCNALYKKSDKSPVLKETELLTSVYKNYTSIKLEKLNNKINACSATFIKLALGIKGSQLSALGVLLYNSYNSILNSQIYTTTAKKYCKPCGDAISIKDKLIVEI